jgi:hypothetical protein
MEILVTIWNFVVSHWNNVTTVITTAKLGADTIDSFKKILPEKLEAKQIAQASLEKSATLLNDQSVQVEEKKWEIATRHKLAKSMVQLTALEAAYNVARASVIVIFYIVTMNFLRRVLTKGKTT